jgi:hypothetical protein
MIAVAYCTSVDGKKRRSAGRDGDGSGLVVVTVWSFDSTMESLIDNREGGANVVSDKRVVISFYLSFFFY